MKTILLALCVVLVAVYGSGCATIVTGKYQNVVVTSDPPSVMVKAETGESLTTPGTFHFLRNKDHVLVAQYAGYPPQQRHIKHKVQGWFWGNILLGGIIGGVVDLASGSSGKLVPNKVHFDFTASGLKVQNRKRSYLESHPDTTEEVSFAIENELAAKGMTKDQLIASFGEPDQVEGTKECDVFVYHNRKPQRYSFKDGKLEKAN